MIYQIYLAVMIYFILSNLTIIESSYDDFKITRSRETKMLMKKKIKKGFKNLMLSLVWPILIYKIIATSLKSIEIVKDK